MDGEWDWKLQSDWYSPTRLHDSPVKYDFPGDRFIPNRSLMDLDQARGELTNTKPPQLCHSKFKSEFRQGLENLTLSAEGRPFQMMVFRGSPRSNRRMSPMVDEMRRSDDAIPTPRPPLRQFPKRESRILDAPDIKYDYYLNIMDWGKTNVLAIGLGKSVFLWNSENHKVEQLSQVSGDNYPAGVSWSEDGKTIAVGYGCSTVGLYDAKSLKHMRWLYGHRGRVGSFAWNDHILSSGSSDQAIINHDVRAKNSKVSSVKVHKREVCGLEWSRAGTKLASGGNDNLVYIWDARKMGASDYVYRFNDHRAAVKALAWCPYDYNVLASGGGTADGSIKIWNVQNGSCISSTETKAQISGLQWNRHHKEILSGHGFGSESENRLCLWKYPAMSKIGESSKHESRILHLTQSPDGVTVVSAGEDEKLRLWEVFGPVRDDKSRMSYLEGLLSLKMSPMR